MTIQLLRRRVLTVLIGLGVVAAVAGVAPVPAGAAATDPIDTSVPMGVASWGVDRLDLFAKGIDGTLKHKVYNGRWSGWESLGGAITSGPSAVSWAAGRIDVVARGTAGDVQHLYYSNGSWGAWQSLGGGILNEPSITSWGANHLEVFVRGTNNAIYHRGWNGSAWGSAWLSLGGAATSSPTAASWASGRLDVFTRGTNNSLYHRWYSGGVWSSATWENLGGTLTSSPAAFSLRSGHVEIFARGTGNGMWHKWYSSSGWSAWAGLGGSLTTAPTVADWSSTRADVFARGADHSLQHLYANSGSWSSWVTEGDSAPTLAVPQYTPTVAMQASPVTGATLGTIEYAYVDNLGRIVSGHQPDPANVGSVQWTVISGNEAFRGPAGIVEQPDGRLQLSAQHSQSDVLVRAQTTKGASTWTQWLYQGGAMSSPVTVARQTDGSVVLFALDQSGRPDYLTQSSVAGPYNTWRNLGSVTLTGPVTATLGQNGLQLFGIDTTGAVQTVTLYANGTQTAWTNLGGTGYSGTPAVVVYPGYRMRVFARAADGTIVTKIQDASLAWPADWSPVGTQIAAGSPAAVLSPLSGKTEILVRTRDGDIASTGETTQGSGTWRDWVPVLQGGDIAATDPATLSYNDGSSLRWAFLFRTADQVSRLYTVDTGLTALTVQDNGVRFHATTLPAPPA
jgi:hypothetical protein